MHARLLGLSSHCRSARQVLRRGAADAVQQPAAAAASPQRASHRARPIEDAPPPAPPPAPPRDELAELREAVDQGCIEEWAAAGRLRRATRLAKKAVDAGVEVDLTRVRALLATASRSWPRPACVSACCSIASPAAFASCVHCLRGQDTAFASRSSFLVRRASFEPGCPRLTQCLSAFFSETPPFLAALRRAGQRAAAVLRRAGRVGRDRGWLQADRAGRPDPRRRVIPSGDDSGGGRRGFRPRALGTQGASPSPLSETRRALHVNVVSWWQAALKAGVRLNPMVVAALRQCCDAHSIRSKESLWREAHRVLYTQAARAQARGLQVRAVLLGSCTSSASVSALPLLCLCFSASLLSTALPPLCPCLLHCHPPASQVPLTHAFRSQHDSHLLARSAAAPQGKAVF